MILNIGKLNYDIKYCTENLYINELEILEVLDVGFTSIFDGNTFDIFKELKETNCQFKIINNDKDYNYTANAYNQFNFDTENNNLLIKLKF